MTEPWPEGWGAPEEGPSVTPEPRYSPVRLDKFIVLSLATGTIYQMVWFWRNWKYVKAVEGTAIWPGARAFFGPLFYHGLLRRLEIAGAAWLAVALFVITATWRAPGALWLVSLLAFLPVIPAVQRVNRLNEGVSGQVASFGWRKRDVAAVGVGTVFMSLALLGTFMPSSSVTEGERIDPDVVRFLLDEGVLAEDEEALFFYSPGLLSYRGEGVVASQIGVTAYWTDPVTEDVMVAYMAYEEITEVEVRRAEAWYEDTVVRLYNAAGDWMVFVVSAEEGGDQRFLDALEERRAAAARRGISA